MEVDRNCRFGVVKINSNLFCISLGFCYLCIQITNPKDMNARNIGFCVCLLLLSTIVFVACGNDEQQVEYASIEDPISLLIPYYLESKGLPETSADSIVRFVHKFGDYVKANPACRGDEYYQPTYDNMVYAASLFGLTITTVTTGIKLETDWFGGYEVNF